MKKIGGHISTLLKALPWALSAILLATLVGVLLIPSVAKALEAVTSLLPHIGSAHALVQPTYEDALIGHAERLTLSMPEHAATLTGSDR